MKFLVNWTLDGFRDKVHEAGQVIEADIKEVELWVAKEYGGLVHHKDAAVLTPVDNAATPPASTEPANTVPGGDVDLSKLKKDDLLAHADEHHGLQLDPSMKKDDIVAAIETARATPPASTEPQ